MTDTFSFPQALERILFSLEKPASDSSPSGTISSWTDLCWGSLASGVLDQLVWPSLPQGSGEIPVPTHHSRTGTLFLSSTLTSYRTRRCCNRSSPFLISARTNITIMKSFSYLLLMMVFTTALLAQFPLPNIHPFFHRSAICQVHFTWSRLGLTAY